MSLKKIAQSILKSGTVSGTVTGTECPTIPENKKPSGTALNGVVKPNTESVPLSRPYMFGTVGQQPKTGTVSGTVSGTEEFMALVHAGHIALLTDGGEGLYPVPRSVWADDNWSQVQTMWLKCFPEIFARYENLYERA